MSVLFGRKRTAVTKDRLRSRVIVAAIIPLVVLLTVSLTKTRASAVGSTRPLSITEHSLAPARIIAQEGETDENEVSTDEVEKYVSVYKAMQRNRSMTVDQAAAAQGLSTKQFRELENRVQRDDAALQQVRDELQAAAQSPPPSRGSAAMRP
jgi:hypothetical protein